MTKRTLKFGSTGNTVVEYVTLNPKIEGSNPSTGSGGDVL